MNSATDSRIRQGSRSIAEQLERDILTGRLVEGSRLPAIRSLAEDLDVSPATVAAAYQTLRTRGLVVASRRGTLVAPAPSLSPRVEATIPESVRDLATGNPDPELLPDLGTLELDGDPLLYGESQNLEELLELARVVFVADGLPGDYIAVVGGALDGVERALSAYLRPGDRVAIEDPGHAGSFDLLRAMGLELVPIAMDQEGPLPDVVQEVVGSGIEAIIMTMRAQNPTGAAISFDRAGDLSAIFDQSPDLLVLEDDHAGPVSGVPVATTFHAARRRWATVRSVGKFLAPDLRVALMTGDLLTMRRLESRQLVGTGWVSQLLQRVVATRWLSPEVTNALSIAELRYTQRREALLTELERRGIAADGHSGWNVWIPVRQETPVVQSMRDRGWAIAAGEHFRLASPPAVRITASTLEPEDAAQVADDLADTLFRGTTHSV